MRAAIIKNGVVKNIILVKSINDLPGLVAAGEANIGDLWDGSVFTTPAPPAPTLQELTAALQSLLDTTAQQRLYDGILSLCTYIGSTNPQFAAEGMAGVVWRDAVWAKGHEIMADVLGGKRGIPTESELIAEMPVFTWP
jgi:hypothetical protein